MHCLVSFLHFLCSMRVSGNSCNSMQAEASNASKAAAPSIPPAGFSLDHMEDFRNKVNMMQTDMPHAIVCTDPDPRLSRPDVLVLTSTATGSLPLRKDLVNTLRNVLQNSKLPKHNGYRMEELVHPNSGAKAQAIFFYNVQPDSTWPGQVVCNWLFLFGFLRNWCIAASEVYE